MLLCFYGSFELVFDAFGDAASDEVAAASGLGDLHVVFLLLLGAERTPVPQDGDIFRVNVHEDRCNRHIDAHEVRQQRFRLGGGEFCRRIAVGLVVAYIPRGRFRIQFGGRRLLGAPDRRGRSVAGHAHHDGAGKLAVFGDK